MTKTIEDIHRSVGRLIHAAIGEDWDSEMVSEVIDGFAEPSYGSTDAVIVLGDWNPPRYPREGDGEPPLTRAERLPVRLAAALERAGAEVAWCDEWAACGECYRAIRTEPDCYSWTMFGAYIEDEGYVCANCLKGNASSYLDRYINKPTMAITWLDASELIKLGYESWGSRKFQNGWYEGQNDDPPKILDGIRSIHPDSKVVFLIDGVGQFDVHFSAWVKFEAEAEDEVEAD